MDPAMRDAARRQPPLRHERPIAASWRRAGGDAGAGLPAGRPTGHRGRRPNAQAGSRVPRPRAREAGPPTSRSSTSDRRDCRPARRCGRPSWSTAAPVPSASSIAMRRAPWAVRGSCAAGSRAAAARQTAMAAQGQPRPAARRAGPAVAHGDQRLGRREVAGRRLAHRRRGARGAGRRGPTPRRSPGSTTVPSSMTWPPFDRCAPSCGRHAVRSIAVRRPRCVTRFNDSAAAWPTPARPHRSCSLTFRPGP